MYTTNALQSLSSQTLQHWTATGTTDRTPAAKNTDFTAAVDAADSAVREKAYIAHLRSKYGPHFRIESVPRDPEVLERIGRGMSGDDVIISPVVLAKMVADPDVASYYERTIDHVFDTLIPQETARCAAMGLVFEPCGVVVHDDGTVTFICGCSDSPERVAQVNAINEAKDAKRAEVSRLYIESAAEHAQQLREMFAQRAEAQSARLGVMVAARNDAFFSANASPSGLPQPGIGPSSTF